MAQSKMKYTGILLSIILLAGCGGGGSPAPQASVEPEVVSGCGTKNVGNLWSGEDYTKSIGNYTVSTNAWNKQMLTDWTVCIRSASLTQNGIKATFDIEWPFFVGTDAVRSFTNVTYTPDPGFENPHSWFGTKALDPIPITNLSKFVLKHDVSVDYTGYTQTFYLFGIDPSPVKNINYKAPLVEMGINLHPLAQSPDHVIDVITVDGNTYWVQNWERTVDGNRLIELAFQSQNKYFKGTVPLKPFFDYILEKNILPSSYYLHSIELGMEAFSGKGTFTINEFSVTK